MILWMEEILHRVIGGLSMFIPLCTDFQPSQVVQDFFHPQYYIPVIVGYVNATSDTPDGTSTTIQGAGFPPREASAFR